VNPAIIAGLEVIKAPEAHHIEGAVGGTINLRTIRPLDLFETLNLAGSLEFKPTQDLRLFADVVYNDQQRDLSGSRVQASNVSRLNGPGDRAVVPGGSVNFTAFDTVDIGSVQGENGNQDFGSIASGQP